eukprot:CAMPEP_0172646324 /NCGR_PEP_ID=MMETSP1068-20121228/240185_1 /TAXON_ID=35684 /ORGANISM="Pseudopedinella elastica, Strain CCMP716" /LENGTH=146 /DNA_ID=CAMNT_0013460581 /DNA_START=313 /DNA_END=753 /DNA_ORIENTATION=-
MDMLRVQSVKATVDKLAPELVRGARAGTDRTAATDETSVKKCHSHPESTPPAAPKKNMIRNHSVDDLTEEDRVVVPIEEDSDKGRENDVEALGRLPRRPSLLSLLIVPEKNPDAPQKNPSRPHPDSAAPSPVSVVCHTPPFRAKCP